MKALNEQNSPNAFALVACLSLFIIPTLFCTSNVLAAEINWANVETSTITVFYPGVSSWEFMRGKDHGTGAAVVKKGKKSCAKCHINKTGKYDINADKIISGELKKAKSGKPFESSPMPGEKGFKDVAFQAAYDAKNIYFRFQWHDSAAVDPEKTADAPATLSVQLNENIKSFGNYGCFIACHDDQTGMPKNTGEDMKLYGYYTRAKGKVKPQSKLDGYLSKGQFIDLWIASFEGNRVKVTDEYILQDRLDDQNDLSATGSFEDGKYTVVITRKLSTDDSKDIAFKDGSALNIGIGIHKSGNKDGRHYSSFPVSVGLSTPADVTAQKF